MSTKTTFKRIALVAVASLGFGVLTSVAPATAAYLGAVTSITPGASSAARVGIASNNTVTLNGTFAASDTVTVSVRVISAPTGSAFATAAGANDSFKAGVQATGTPNKASIDITKGTATGAAVATTPNNYSVATAVAGTNTNYVAARATVAGGSSAGTTMPIKISTTPDVAGTYTVLVSVATTNRAAVADGTFIAGDVSTTYTFTTAGAPATVAISAIGGTGNSGGVGRLVLVSVKDAAGNATVPTDTESINLTSSKTTTGFSTTTDVTTNPATSPTANTLGLSAANFIAGTGSSALVRVTDAASTTATVITATGGGTLSPSVSIQASLTFTASTLTGASTAKLGQITATVAYPENGYALMPTVSANAATANVVSTSTSRSWRVVYTNASTTTAAVAEVTVTDTSGLITGVASATYAQSVTIPATATTTGAVSPTGANFTVTTLAPIGTASYAVALTTTSTTATDLLTLTVTGALSDPVGAAAKIAPVGVAAFTAAPASTVTQTVKLTDQFGAAIANRAITVGITGRNAAKTGAVIITDATGHASYALLDAGTLGTTDTLTFTAGSAVSTTATTTITWGAVTVSTVTLNGGNTTAGVADATATIRDINAGDGVESTTYGISATLKDANGVLLGGVPVVFSVAGSGAAITSTTINGVTSSAGVATAQVYGWIAGTYTVTAVAGGVTATGTITFGQTAKGEERAVSATVSGPIVTAKTVDRFGNPVPGVTVYATKTGTGYFGAGVTKTSGVTSADGTVEFVIAGGSADVTVSTIDYAAAAGTFGSGQTSAPKGYLANATTAAALALNIFTASAAGTATKNEVGVGASFDAAGVASATVSVDLPDTAQAASDAAAEATDAANAATDAANAAAEAADAATAAAQDAADAVAALSTQVTELVSALRKQITSLTNLVIKIQKKVRA
jgi:trimeric autotransporter adhesin